MSYGLDQSRRKWVPSTSRSVVATTCPSGAETSAASSPGPCGDGGTPGAPASREINPNSPTPLTSVILRSGAERPSGTRSSPAQPFAGSQRHPCQQGVPMVHAYILIQTEVGKAATVAAAIAALDGVTNA